MLRMDPSSVNHVREPFGQIADRDPEQGSQQERQHLKRQWRVRAGHAQESQEPAVHASVAYLRHDRSADVTTHRARVYQADTRSVYRLDVCW